MAERRLKSGTWRLSPGVLEVPVMEVRDHLLVRPTYSVWPAAAASRRLPFCSASSHQAARSSAFTSRTWLLVALGPLRGDAEHLLRVIAPDLVIRDGRRLLPWRPPAGSRAPHKPAMVPASRVAGIWGGV